MQNSWYVARSGKALGPRTKEEIEADLKSGAMSSNDFIFREGEKEWKKLSEYPEFLRVVTDITPAPKPVETFGEWVLLTRNLEDTQPGRTRYVQSGPFTKTDVMEKIKTGEVRWGDFVWKKGFSSWEKLSRISEFNSTMEFVDDLTPTVPTQNTSEDLLAKVLVSEPKPIPPFELEESKPMGVTGENLALNVGAGISIKPLTIKAEEKPSASSLTQEEVEKAMSLSPSDSQKSNTVFSLAEETQSKIKLDAIRPKKIEPKSESKSVGFFTPKRIMLYGGTFVIIGIILSLSLLVTNPNAEKAQEAAVEPAKREVASVPPSSAPAATPTPSTTEKIVGRPTEPTAQKPVLPVAQTPTAPSVPKFIKIVPLKLDSSQPQIALENNIDANEPIQIHMLSKSGQILNVIRFDRKTQITRNTNELPTFNLSQWSPPPGSYTFEAKSGSTSAKQSIFIGQKNRGFQTLLDRHNKKIAAQKKGEKKEIEIALGKLDTMANQLQKKYGVLKKSASKWKDFYKTWSKDLASLNKGVLSSYRASKSDKFVYPEAIADTREGANELFKAGRAYNDAVKLKRAPASGLDLKPLRTKLNQIKSSL